MNKKIIASVLAVVFAISMAGPVGAVTLEELETLYADLLAKYEVLLAQVGQPAVATGVCFDADLQQGMTSDDVKALQIKLGVIPTSGYFGPITLAAVKTFQTANGIINTGYVGPLTRAQLNALYCTPAPVVTYPEGCTSAVGFSPTTGLSCAGVVSYPEGCTSAVGFSPTTGLSCAGEVVTYPEGCTSAVGFSPTTGLSCAGTTTVVAPAEGSITVNYDAIPAANVVISKGVANQSAIALKIKATGSDMKISRVWLDFDKRLWLYADSASLLDGSTVLAAAALSSSAFSEVTAGSKWQLQFNNLDVVVSAGTTKILTLKLGRPMLTQASAVVTLQTTSSVRATDDAGFTDAYVVSATRAMNLITTAALSGTLTASSNVNSPAIQSVSGLSDIAGTLTPVKLLDFNLKAKYADMNVTTIVAALAGGTVANAVASVELRDGTSVLSSVTGADTATFSSLDIDIVKDATKILSIWVQMNPIGTAGAGKTAKGQDFTATLTSASTITTDEAFNTYVVTSADVVGKKQYMFQYAPTFALISASAVPVDETGSATSTQTGGAYSIAFSVTAPADIDILVEAASTTAVVTFGAATAGTSKTVDATGGTLVTGSSVSGVTSKGTVADTFDKVVAGATRTFTVTGRIPHGGNAGFVGMHIEGIQWTDTDDTDHATTSIEQIWGLSDFKTADVYVTI